MNEEPEVSTPPERETILQVYREALEASLQSMRILQEAGDIPNTLKAAATVTAITHRISKLELPGEAKEVGGQKQRKAFILTLIKALKDPDPKRRQQVIDSLERGLKSLQEPEEPEEPEVPPS